MNRFLYPGQIYNILSVGVYLNNIGINNWALTREQALIAISKLAELQIVILGGEVYIKTDSCFELTYDNWSIDRKNSTETDFEYLERSINKSLEYISNYPNKNAFFGLVPRFEVISLVLSGQIYNILSVGVYLNNIGINNWALTREQALIAISKLAELQIVILGGEVYIKTDSCFELTYDNWSIDRKNSTETDFEYLERSISKSLEHISNYPNKNAFFGLVPEIEH